MKKILFVCLGNICRSAAAEGIMTYLLSQHNLQDQYCVDSAGTYGGHAGQPADQRMQDAAQKRGYILHSRSRKITGDDFRSAHIILAMDDSNYSDLFRLAPDLESSQKIHRMVEFCTHSQATHVPDPYYEGAEGFDLVLDLLEDACSGLLSSFRI